MTRAEKILETYYERENKAAAKEDKWAKYDKEVGRQRAMRLRDSRQPEKKRK